MGALVCSAVHSIRDVCEMIVAIDLLPGAESIDKDRYTYPTVIPNFLPLAALRLCVRHGSRILVRLRLTAKRKTVPPFASLRLCVRHGSISAHVGLICVFA